MESDSNRRISRSLGTLTEKGIGRLAARIVPSRTRAAIKRAIVHSPLGDYLEKRLAVRSSAAQAAYYRNVSKNELADDLNRIDLPLGSTLFVHSSLSRLGYVEGGAATVVDLLQENVNEKRGGTLAMPAFSMRGSMLSTVQQGEVFDIYTSPSRMGKITEEFRQRPGVLRSLHPTHSVAATGTNAQFLVKDHHTDPRTFGPSSPFARLMQTDGWLMGLGVDLGPVTFYHTIEDIRKDFPFNVYTPDSPLHCKCRNEEGVVIDVAIMAHDPHVAKGRIDTSEGERIRALVTQEFTRTSGLTWHKVGNGDAWLISAAAMYDGLERLLAKNITIYTSLNILTEPQ